MQRGAQKRSSEPAIKMRDVYERHPPKIASADKPHLDFLKYGRLERVEKIRTVIDAAKKNGIGTAGEISHLLNKLQIKTAIGERWTPRLAWFASAAVKIQGNEIKTRSSSGDSFGSSRSEVKFRDLVDLVVKSRLEEIQSQFEISVPKLGDALPELAELKRRFEQGLE